MALSKITNDGVTGLSIDSSGIVTPSNPVLFHVYMNANTALADNTGTVLPLQAAEFDTKSFHDTTCLLYTSPSPRDGLLSRMPSSA